MTSGKPEWLHKKFIVEPNQSMVEGLLNELGLNTVCREAMCPNYQECFADKTATFMILGTNCTRNCTFCNVSSGAPPQVDPSEPERVAAAVVKLGLRYAVVTSVTRDDLLDGGAAHFAAVVRAIRASSTETAIEVLIPDFLGNYDALGIVASANPTVISQNMETVAALYSEVRPGADYRRSLVLLENIKRLNQKVRSKTGIMLGLGETRAQVMELFDDLRGVGCELLTIGQYLMPSKNHYQLREYIHPDQFDEYGAIALDKGFDFVASAPFVRSSYRAGEAILSRY
ncbi:MAG: lipoyl synthase [Synergistaceae bacterium]|jgi:lipoic acid synthetase|nr:lipoyl synthase [Synergistaceae bacterium]